MTVVERRHGGRGREGGAAGSQAGRGKAGVGLSHAFTILDGLRPSPHMWSAGIITNIADHGHLVEVEEL